MKKYASRFILLAALCAGLYACGDDYLDQAPTENVDAESVTATTSNLIAAINGIHRSLYQVYNNQGEGGVGCMMIQTDMLGEDLVMTSQGNGWFNNMYRWIAHTDANTADALFPYRVYYRIIRNANVIINGGVNAVGPDAERNVAIGQALVYRAFCHFQLVQLYGGRYVSGGNNGQLGVPIMVVVDDNTLLPRATVEEVYTQVNQDLDQALVLLEGYTRPNKSHLNTSVALGLKARVALVQGDWAEASQFAQQALAGFSLMTNPQYQAGFNDYTNSEWMWGSHIQEDQSEFFANYGAYMSRNFSSTNIRTNPKAIYVPLYNLMAATDVRRAVVDPTGQHVALALPANFSRRPYTSQKFIAAGTGDSRVDVPYMRAAEMYLIDAEARARMGDDVGARQALFTLASNRNPLYVLSVNAGQALIDEVLLHRRFEFWGEGFRFLDLKRLNAPLVRNNAGTNHNGALVGGVFTVPAGDNRWQWQIPQNEINANPLIEQNPL